ncbi:MAG: DUF971 domain-containing protein [Alphaproteobacteria bacterium]|nr:DUF971 domain-containing protein [Alphaproteobacteria bacterium]
MRLGADRASLVLAWPGGATSELSAAALRAACRCADCTRSRADGRFPAAFPPLTVDGVEAIGSYAVNLRFSDGHARGIYPWSLLRSLADAPEA